MTHRNEELLRQYFKAAENGDIATLNELFADDVVGAGDVFGLLTDNPAARELIAYLASPEAQTIWVGAGGALSVDQTVTRYPDDVSARAAQLIAERTSGRLVVIPSGPNVRDRETYAAWMERVVTALAREGIGVDGVATAAAATGYPFWLRARYRSSARSGSLRRACSAMSYSAFSNRS